MNKKILSTFIATVMIFTSIGSGRVFANSIENSNKKMTSAKEMTNVYKVWNDYKYKGEGMVISVIDSGIDYTHKDMKITDTSKMKIKDKIVSGKGKYFSDKVPYGYNFADDNENIIDTESMHGMHVAGIVAANGDEKDVKAENAMQGVAPEAQLFAMKVFANDSDFPSCNNDDVVEAIESSVNHGADVINMSLGSNGACVELDEPSAIAIRNAQQKGVLVVTAAGNSQYSTAPGKYKDIVDTGIIDSPSIYNEAFSVASIENKAIMVQALEYKTPKEKGEIAYCLSEINPLAVLKGDYELVECGLGKISDFKGKNLKGKIALVKRGSNGFLEKKINAQKSGAVGIIVYNEDDKKGHEYMNEEEQVNIPAISITNEDGNKLKKLIASKVKIKFVDKYKSIENPDKVTMSSFSSWGPASNLEMKPEITAPGGEIWSTLNNNKYGIKSGTSMATPHVAGAMALLLQHMKTLDFGNITPNEKIEMAKTIAMNTAKVQIDPETEEKRIPFSPRRQGSGLIDINAALNNNVIVSDSRGKGNVALKDFSEQSKTFSLKLKNFGKKDALYTVKDLSGVLTEQTEDIKSISYDVLLDGAKITFDKNEIVVPAGKEVNFNVTLDLSKDTPKNIFIEGFINLEAKTSDMESIGIPYMGFYGKWDELPIVDKAVWEKESKLKKTGLYKINQEGKLDILGVSNNKDGLSVDVEEETIAMTTGNGKAIVVPKLALLRNVNNIYVDLLDANNNVIRNIGADSNLSKYIWAPEDLESADNDNYEKPYPWSWDLTKYNKSTGHYEIVKDGQYYIQVKCNVDYPNAKYQTIKMPIKIDSVKPELKISLQKSSVLDKKYKLKYKVTDDFSGISNVYININDEPYLKEGDEKIAYKPNANGECNVDLELLKGNNNIKVYAVDNAGNVSVDEIDVELGDIVITSYENGQAVDGQNLKLTYNITKELKAKAKYFSVYVDDKEVGKGNKDMSYNIKELSAGVHDISVSAYDKNKKILASADSWVFVKFKELYINFVGVKREGSFYNERNVNLKGNLSTGTKVFTIQGKNVNLENDLTFKTDIELKEGLNKVKVYAEDNNNNNKFDYALNLYCDLTSPELNITSNNNGEKCTLQCEVKDNNPFYKLYVNGDEVKSIDSNWSKASKYLTDVNLEKGNNVIEVKAIDVAGNSIVKNVNIVK